MSFGYDDCLSVMKPFSVDPERKRMRVRKLLYDAQTWCIKQAISLNPINYFLVYITYSSELEILHIFWQMQFLHSPFSYSVSIP